MKTKEKRTVKIQVKKAVKMYGQHSLFLTFDYDEDLVKLMRSIEDRYWHPDSKEWEITPKILPQLQEKLSQGYTLVLDGLENLIQKEIERNPVELPESFKFKTEPYEYQKEGFYFGLQNLKFLLADEMGCIAEDSLIKVNHCKNSFEITIQELYRLFNRENQKSGDTNWYGRCLLNGHFGLNLINSVVYSGEKETYRITLESGKNLTATADHKILTNNGYRELQNLKLGDIILTNGKQMCVECGSDKDIITYSYAKFKGYCKKCMLKNRDGTKYKGGEIGKYVDKDGYVKMFGKEFRQHPNLTINGMPEHVWVMSQHLNRPLEKDEIVHHRDENKQNNSLDNLLLTDIKEHAKIHSVKKTSHFYKNFIKKNGKEIIMIPKEDKLVNIEYVGVKKTYDISMKSPHNNFIANGIVVHNCGKTKQSIDIAIANKIKFGYKHCLIIVCVNGLKWNWKSEIEIHSNEKAWILGQRYNPKKGWTIGSNQDKLYDIFNLPDTYFLITNIESLRDKNITEALQKLCKDEVIQMITLDEAHKCFNYETELITDQGFKKIGEIVKNKINCSILSYNEKLQKTEYKPIKNWFENKIEEKMLNLEILIDQELKKIKVTDTHLFLTKNRGWIMAKEITKFDELICY